MFGWASNLQKLTDIAHARSMHQSAFSVGREI